MQMYSNFEDFSIVHCLGWEYNDPYCSLFFRGCMILKTDFNSPSRGGMKPVGMAYNANRLQPGCLLQGYCNLGFSIKLWRKRVIKNTLLNHDPGGGFNVFLFLPYLGRCSSLTSIFFNWVETTN